MTEKDDFGFEEQPETDEQDPGAAMIEEELRRNLGEPAAVEKRSPSRVFLLLVLLLVLGGAAAFFYLGNPAGPETPPPAPPVRQPIALPPPPASKEEAMVKTESVSPVPPSVEAPAAPTVEPEVPVKAAEPAVKAPVPAKTVESPARTETSQPPPPAEQAVASADVASKAAGPYFLQAGAFLLKANLREAEGVVRRLGYEPRVKSMRKTIPMTRLRLGAFFADEGKAKLESLKAVASDAFMIREGEYVLVYAGTYQDLDRARRAADILYQKGIRVEEEPVEAEVSLSLLSFGDFADRAAAARAADLARSAGLEVIVRKAH